MRNWSQVLPGRTALENGKQLQDPGFSGYPAAWPHRREKRGYARWVFNQISRTFQPTAPTPDLRLSLKR